MSSGVGPIPFFRPAPFGLARRPARASAPTAAPAPDIPAAEPPPMAETASRDPEPWGRTSWDDATSWPFGSASDPDPEPAPPEPPRRRRLPGASAETLPLRRRLSDALRLWAGCGVKGCRRARRCLGVRGCACLVDRPPEVEAALTAFRRGLEGGLRDGAVSPSPASSPSPARGRGSG